MAAFDENFGTELTKKDADELSFRDIMVTVYEKRPGIDDVILYPLIKRTVGHGVTAVQKKFLYEYTKILFCDEAGADFDDCVDDVRASMNGFSEGVPWAARTMIMSDKFGSFALSIFMYPMCFIEYLRKVPETDNLIEAILVQNGGIMLVRTVHDYEKLQENPFGGDNGGWLNLDDDDDDDDEYDDEDY